MSPRLLLAALCLLEALGGLGAAGIALQWSTALVWIPGIAFVLAIVIWAWLFRRAVRELPSLGRVMMAGLLASVSYFLAFLGFAFAGGILEAIGANSQTEIWLALWAGGAVASIILAVAIEMLGGRQFGRSLAQFIVASTCSVIAIGLVSRLPVNGTYTLLSIGQVAMSIPAGLFLAGGTGGTGENPRTD